MPLASPLRVGPLFDLLLCPIIPWGMFFHCYHFPWKVVLHSSLRNWSLSYHFHLYGVGCRIIWDFLLFHQYIPYAISSIVLPVCFFKSVPVFFLSHSLPPIIFYTFYSICSTSPLSGASTPIIRTFIYTIYLDLDLPYYHSLYLGGHLGSWSFIYIGDDPLSSWFPTSSSVYLHPHQLHSSSLLGGQFASIYFSCSIFIWFTQLSFLCVVGSWTSYVELAAPHFNLLFIYSVPSSISSFLRAYINPILFILSL